MSDGRRFRDNIGAIYRSAKTGRFVSRQYAKRHPATTVAHPVNFSVAPKYRWLERRRKFTP